MLDGREALMQIDRAIDEARRDGDTLKASLAELNAQETEMRAELRRALEELARFRLDQTRAGEVSAAVAGVGREITSLLEAREGEYTELIRALAVTGEEIAKLEARRGEAAAAAGNAAGALDAGEAALQRALEQDRDHRKLFGQAEAAGAVAAEAEHKHALADEDRRVKGEPYEADPLFMYLWRRGHGTPAYRGSGLVRMGDRWVARLIRFDNARANYYMLNEIPKRLGEHAASMRARAEAEVDALAAYESAARDRTDVPGLERALEEAQSAVEAIDSEIAAARGRARENEAARSAFERGDDPKYRAAVEAMVSALDDDSIAELRRAARRTRMPEDDRIVERLVELEDDLGALVRERDELARHARSRTERLVELEDMRVEFRRRRYDDYGSGFTDGGLFAVILAEFVRGAISGSVYWDRLARSHRRIARSSSPDFGSGRFRFPGPTSFPGASRGGGFGGGGFRTGGGLGGGGFRTGGGF